MEIEKLLKYAKELVNVEDEKFSFTKNNDKITQILMSASKLSADVGELNKNLLEHVNLSTKYKLDKFKHEDLEKSIVEVLFQLFYISQVSNVDIEKAINDKIEILERIYKINE